MYETESDKFSFYTLLYLPLPDCSFYFVPLRLTNFYFNLIQFRMKQKIVAITRSIDELNDLESYLNSIVSDFNLKGWKVSSLSTCDSTQVSNSGRENHRITILLLLDKI